MLQSFKLFADACSGGSFFGIPTWYKYLVLAGKMEVSNVTGACELARTAVAQPSDWGVVVTLVALAIVDMLLRIAGLIAVFMVIYGGVRYVTSTGLTDKTKEAQESIINALIGLAISMIAIGMVSFIGNRIGVE